MSRRWIDEEPKREQYVVTWNHENDEGILEDVEIVWAHSRDEALEKFWEIQDRDNEIPDDAEIISVECG